MKKIYPFRCLILLIISIHMAFSLACSLLENLAYRKLKNELTVVIRNNDIAKSREVLTSGLEELRITLSIQEQISTLIDLDSTLSSLANKTEAIS